MKKIIALLIAFVMVFGLTGCVQQETRDKNTIYLDFEIVDNGYGFQWLKDACREFEKLVADKDYDGDGPMKPGVKCKVVDVTSAMELDAIERSGTEVFFSGGAASENIKTGKLLDITDVVNEKNYRAMDEEDPSTYVNDDVASAILNSTYDTADQSIADLIYDETKTLCSVVYPGSDEPTYYSIPTHEIYSGMSYDKDAFDREGFYFAYETSTSVSNRFVSDVTKKEAYFVKPTALDNKSCGPDGVFGTYDDGMPSSLVELITLYDYMDDKGYAPLQVPGQFLYEADFLTDGLYSALLGVDKSRGQFEFTGEYDIVYGLYNSNDGAFGSDSGSALTKYLQPLIETVEVDEESGYYTTWALERYYALMFLNICVEQGWLAKGYDPDVGSYSHREAQRQFIFSSYNKGKGKNGLKVATMATGSYWYNESTNFGNFESFERYNKNVEYRNLLWMPFPTNIFTTVTGEQDGYEDEDYLVTTTLGSGNYTTEIIESTKGEVQAVSQRGINCVYFNDNVRNDTATYEALKDWIRFFHSDQQLEKTTIRQGFRKALKYKVRDLEDITNPTEKAEIKQIMLDRGWADFDDDGNVIWEGFYKQLADYVDSDSAELVRYTSTKQTFLSNTGDGSPFKRGEYSKVSTDATGEAYLKKLVKNNTTYKTAFANTIIKFDEGQTNWKGKYEGNSVAKQLKNGIGETITWRGEVNPA